MDSCSSAKHQSSEDERRTCAKNPAPHFPMLPFSFPTFNFTHNTPFLGQPLRLNSSSPLLVGTSNVVREVQKSILSSVDKYLKILDEFRSRNVVLDKLVSISSHLHKASQVPRRNWQNLAMLPNSNFAAILPGDSVAGLVVANGISNFLNIYNTLLVVRLVLTWFPNVPPAVVRPLSTLCDPYLNIFRGIIPPLGGTLDLSPILAFLVLNAFTSSAAALPAELPTAEASNDPPSPTTTSHLTASQKKWMRRFSGNKSR